MSTISLLDGGMGQELLKRSVNPPSPHWSAQVMMDEPEIVTAIHRDYIEAGARIITINAYSATPERLENLNDPALFERLQQLAIELAEKAKEGLEEDVVIAGCLPPLVGSYRPDLVPEYDTCLATYRRIASCQSDHVDIFLCETMASVREIHAAGNAAVECGKAVWMAMTVIDGDGAKLRSGEPLEDGIAAAIEVGCSAVLVNCSWPESLSEAMPLLAASGLPFGGYANGFTAIDALAPGGTVDILVARDDLGPEAYGNHAMSWINQGATIVGGCCETGPAHIAAIAERLKQADHQIIGIER